MRRAAGDIEEGGECMETTSNLADRVSAAMHAFAEELAYLVENDSAVSNRLQAKFSEFSSQAEASFLPEEDQAKEAVLRRLLVMAVIDLMAKGDLWEKTKLEDIRFGE
jgi:hypothetical protein